ncbi:NAD(P)-dependent alcohol dehydrogenase [Arthrobacter sp. I2-34]|uniref:NAD(P)-dependent alcohol dehydrogenase n=1 Tax=Arthrobacter hankyongi TaxID=2904801 RepID=A0ABS9L3Q6_9MICC|nr:NAD(P)-dependent alcohol dehydrogenase [Arthrobacter hankyongi]MCG2621295.1 NAD(P)-dependent alcohol dehydrogenase [Arthrobacter hankyongi]
MLTTAAVCHAPHQSFKFEDIELAEPQGTEVLVRITASGICHTDISVQQGKIPFSLPGVVGHEGAGIVEAVGRGVTSVRPGDKVLLISPSCGGCGPCTTGHPALCEKPALRWSGVRNDGSPVATLQGQALGMRFLGQSSFSTHALVEERTVLAAPEDIPAETLAPFGCGVVTGAGAVLNVLQPRSNQSVVVLGAGAVGLSAVIAAALTPATKVIAVDMVPERLALARELGATDTINGAETGDLTAAIKEAAGGGADHIVETTANIKVLEAALAALSRGGSMGLVGAPGGGEAATLPVVPFISGAKNLRGVVMGDGTPAFLQALMELYRQGRFPVDKLIRTYPFEQIEQAMADASSGKVIKPVLTFNP